MLPQPNSVYRPDDLVENAIFVASETDATFDDDDYVLFYARGPHTWEPAAPRPPAFSHSLQHLYTDTAYYLFPLAQRRRQAGSHGPRL